MEEVKRILPRSGMCSKLHAKRLLKKGRITVNGDRANLTAAVKEGDEIRFGDNHYCVTKPEGYSRYLLEPQTPVPDYIEGVRRIHCGYHKCLTMYYRNVIDAMCRHRWGYKINFRHFYHRLDEFYRQCHKYTLSSVSGHYIDLNRFEDVRVTRFIRDPRDLLVSGYFYHKRGAERWSRYVDPFAQEWKIVDGRIPDNLPRGESLSSYLERASVEEGLHAEIDFRQKHFRSMLQWQGDNKQVRTYRYEDLMGNERAVFADMLAFYQLPLIAQGVGQFYAYQYSAAKRHGTNKHIRNASGGQWRKYFTPSLRERFNEEWGDLLDRYGYERC